MESTKVPPHWHSFGNKNLDRDVALRMEVISSDLVPVRKR